MTRGFKKWIEGTSLVKRISRKNGEKGTKKESALQADHSEHKYFVQIDNPEAPTIRQSMWIKVYDITSLTKQDESKRQKIVKEEINGKQEQQLQMTNETIADDDIVFEDENNNGSVLDNAITELVSDKELSADTVNLYTCFLNMYYATMTLELYDSAGVSEAHKDVFANLKTKFIHKEMESKKNSWSEHVNNRTPRQSNLVDCGVHMCLMIKRLLQAKFTSPPVAMPDESREMRQEMDDDILNHPFLAAPPDNLKIQDLFLKEVPTKDLLDQQVAAAGCVYRKDVPMDGNCFFHAVSDQLIRLKCPGIPHNVLRQNIRGGCTLFKKGPMGVAFLGVGLVARDLLEITDWKEKEKPDSDAVRKKCIAEGNSLSFKRAREIAHTEEATRLQMNAMSDPQNQREVNSIQNNNKARKQRKGKTHRVNRSNKKPGDEKGASAQHHTPDKCGRCGNTPHKKGQKCPAIDSECFA
ncbi:predicted protein [Nematostella vectensis]|uniref:Ubiquitin-like protease family profile domain-containing protein n=1 Tax=Nematostella vectensis TaxID=45351 RepID=A7SR23_NEMVE|nr:predicted protein [Nematostella vectensis]|eukprot:XP_001625944.1 predicted protein [Nematostella vectensis]